MQDFSPFEMPPGVQVKPTKASKSIHWSESHLMRWGEDGMSQIGGWERLDYSPTSSPVRAVHEWEDTGGKLWKAYLCDDNCYVEFEGGLVLISPAGGMEGPADDLLAGGYGDGPYDEGDYGTARPPRVDRRKVGFAFSIDNWGGDLVFMTSIDGRLLRWTPSDPPVPAVLVPTAPTGRSFIVTPERHVIIFDYNGVKGQLAWSDQEDIANWEFANVLKKAGDLPVEPRAQAVASRRINGIGLLFTTRSAYVIPPRGLPYVYGIEEITGGATPVSAASVMEIPDGAIWPSDSGFWIFNGVSIQPMACPVWKWIDDQIDWDYARFTATAINNVGFSEMWWSFPAKGSQENNKTVIWNYREGWWAMIDMGRSAGSLASYTEFPVMANGTAIYRHESGTQYPDVNLKPYAESFTFNIKGGGNMSTFKQIAPEVHGDGSDVRFSLRYKYRRTPDVEIQSPPARIQPETGCVDFMITGRDFRLRVESVAPGYKEWDWGSTLVDIRPRGSRP